MDLKRSPVITIEIYVSGRVQGVGYQYFTLKTARSLNITGTVRNLPDGGVKIIAQGTRPQLDALITALKKGPTSARVKSISINETDSHPESFSTFDIIT